MPVRVIRRNVDYYANASTNGVTIESSSNYDLNSVTEYNAITKEATACIRAVVKDDVQKKGAAATFQQLLSIPDGHSHLDWYRRYDELQEGKEWGGRLSAQQTYGLFVTLSPEPGSVTAGQLLDKFYSLFGKKPKKGIIMVLYCIENATSDGKDNHPHIHCAIMLDKTVVNGERGKVKSMLERNLRCYKTKSECYLDIKPVSEKNWKNKVSYIQGDKHDVTKQPLVIRDQVWRRENNYDDVYTFLK